MAETPPPPAGEAEEELVLLFRGPPAGIRALAQHWAGWLLEPLPGFECTLIELGRHPRAAASAGEEDDDG